MAIINLISSALIIFFASICIAMLLDVNPLELSTFKKVVLWGGVTLVIATATILAVTMGINKFTKLYPVLVQLPIFIIFCTISRYGYLKTIFALLSAIFLAFPFQLIIRIIIPSLGKEHILTMILCLIITFLVLVFCVYYLMKSSFNYAIEHLDNASILKFCIIPILYNISAYYFGKYTLTNDSMQIRILFFLIVLAAYFLLTDVFRGTMEKQKLRYENNIISLEIDAAKQNLRDFKYMQEQAVIYRHDMRHHFALLSNYLNTNEINKAIDYIKITQKNIESITPQQFCENETVNLILSSFKTRALKNDVQFTTEIVLPNELPIDDTELCTLLSNALENAINAASSIDDKNQRQVKVQSMIRRNMLLILIENTYSGEIAFENNDHGFGTKSMLSIIDKHNGECFFESDSILFTTRIIIPITKNT
jgi:two-component system, LytTR family, sensor histidine kinase AgrC